MPYNIQLITEHSIAIAAEIPQKGVHRKMEVFYNPLMASNRNISILLLNSVDNTNMNIADPLAGSGIRALRFLKEIKKGKMGHIFVNDKKENFVRVFQENLKRNGLNPEESKRYSDKKNKNNKKNEENEKRVSVHSDDAVLFLLNQIKHPVTESFCGYFDYIDIDPFGSPNAFLPAAVSRITRKGILAITATDTAALTGTYPKVTKRKYWAVSLRNYLMHEVGLRILIRKVQLYGVQFDKALLPILSYHKDHYFRVYFRSEKGKEKCDELLRQHQYFLFCPDCLKYEVSNFNKEHCSCGASFAFSGPLWAGKLFDEALVRKMASSNPFPEEEKFLSLLKEEAKEDRVGFYDLHVLAKKYKLKIPRMENILRKLKATKTHFSSNGIKTEKSIKDVLKVLQQK
ncbi:MAG: hypothetical protein AB1668_01645 [Nanoarchaeota archaeon]